MKIYKEGRKIHIDMDSTDVFFNDSSKESANIYIDKSAIDAVVFRITSGATLIGGLGPYDYKELYDTVLQKVDEIIKRKSWKKEGRDSNVT